MRNDYWEQSAQPLNSLCFVAPLLVVYEFGMIRLGPEAMRNGADIWLRNLLATLGFGEYFVLPGLTCALLLGWHHLTRRTWKFHSDVLSGMVCESVLLGCGLVIISRLYAQLASDALLVSQETTAAVGGPRQFSHLLSFVGAGIYEETLFRLLLLSLMIFACRRIGADIVSATVVGIVATSILFASAHYRIFFEMGDNFTWCSFVFRLGAGSLFSILFLRRGFGIAVGTHAAYDILVATMS